MSAPLSLNNRAAEAAAELRAIFAVAFFPVVGIAAGATYYRIMGPQRPLTKMIVGLAATCIALATAALLLSSVTYPALPLTRAFLMIIPVDVTRTMVIITAIATLVGKIDRAF